MPKLTGIVEIKVTTKHEWVSVPIYWPQQNILVQNENNPMRQHFIDKCSALNIKCNNKKYIFTNIMERHGKNYMLPSHNHFNY